MSRATASRLNWVAVAPMEVERLSCAAVAVGGKLYVVGGEVFDGTHPLDCCKLGTVECYDGEGWTEHGTKMITPRDSCAAAAIGNRIYVAGGDSGVSNRLHSLQTAEVLDLNTRRSTALPPMSSKRWGCVGVIVGNEFFVIGGNDGSSCTAEVYNIITKEWAALPKMITERRYCAAAAIGKRIFVVGGEDKRQESFDTAEVFDTETRTWTELPPMNTRRSCCGTAAIGRHLYVAGGCGGDDEQTDLGTAEVYDVDAGVWTELPPMAMERYCCAAVAMGGAMYLVGGGNEMCEPVGVEKMDVSDEIVLGILLQWSGGTWSNDVSPILHQRTSVLQKMEIDPIVMPILLNRIGQEYKVQTLFKIVRETMDLFDNTLIPNKRQKV